MAPREISFDTCLNFRDLGGYRTEDGRTVRFGRLYRSMTPEFMTPADVERARAELGIDLVLDLRNAPDRDSGSIGEAPARRHVLAFVEMADFDDLRNLAPEVALPLHLELSAGAIAEGVGVLSEARDSAALFHCQTGKDRTGVLAAVVLRLLGVSEDDVIADYMAGAHLADDVLALLAANGRPMSPRAPQHAKEPPKAEAMRALLSRLEGDLGGARAYLLSQGIAAESLDGFIGEMVEPAESR